MTADQSDPVLMLLAAARAPRPTGLSEQRIRRRCHAAIARSIRPAPAARPFAERSADAMLLAMVGSYAAVALIQVTQVAAQLLRLH